MKNLLFIIFLVSILPSCQVNTGESDSRPNVVFIITDDQPFESFGFLENKAVTPRIDQLSEEGITFSNAFVASSVCTPSRFTCLTGNYASNCRTERFLSDFSEEGVPHIAWNLGLASGHRLIPDVLQEAGYRTGFVGKWHVGGIGRNSKRVPPGSDPTDPGVAKILKENHEGYCRDLIEGKGFDYADAVYRGNPDDDRNLVNSGCNVHNMEWLTQAALNFIESSKEEPFYLYFSPTLLHSPSRLEALNADPRISGEGLLDEPITGILPSRESVLERAEEAGIEGELIGATWLDDGIGAILDKLDELGIAENTVVIYFNDNGYNDHAKGTCYEGGIKIPVIAKWTGQIKPGIEDRFISNIDFVPTILDICGVEKPEDMELDGESLVPMMMGKEVENWRTSIYTEIGYTRAVRTEDWKYIAFKVPPSVNRTVEERFKEYEPYYKDQMEKNPWMSERHTFNPEAPYYHLGIRAGGYQFEWGQYNPEAPWYDNYFDSDQLYDLKNDPKETNNLANDPEMAEKLAEMKALLVKHLENLPGDFEDMLD